MSGSVTGMAPSSEVDVLPRKTKPARRKSATDASSTGASSGGSARVPKRVRVPRSRFKSLTPTGTPKKSGRGAERPSRS